MPIVIFSPGIAEGIVDQIPENGIEQGMISFDFHTFIYVVKNLNMVVADLILQVSSHFCNCVVNIDTFFFEEIGRFFRFSN